MSKTENKHKADTPYSNFLATIKKWNELGMAFTTIKDNSNITIIREDKFPKKIHLPDVSFRESKGNKDGFFLCPMVRKDVSLLKISKIPKAKYYITKWYITKNILNNIYEDIYQIDINACYWRVAYILNLISENTYLNGLKKRSYKTGRNIALGSLANKIEIRKYRDGNCIEVKYKEKKTKKVWEAIVDYVYRLSQKIYKKYPHDVLFFETDCFFVSEKVAEKVKKQITKEGFKVSSKKIRIKKIKQEKNKDISILIGNKKYIYSKNNELKWIQTNGKTMRRNKHKRT